MRKGIGLSSLIMYVIGLTIVISIITTFNLNILDATNNFTDTARINEQYMKFNKFFISSIKDASYILITVPTSAVRSTLEKVKPLLTQNVLLEPSANYTICVVTLGNLYLF